MKHSPTRMASWPPVESRGASSAGELALLETEIVELKQENARLQRRLEEAEMSAEYRVRADRILAIPIPEGR